MYLNWIFQRFLALGIVLCVWTSAAPCFAATVSGIVTNTEGQPLANVNVTVIDTELLCSVTEALPTAEDGNFFTFFPFPDGTYYILIQGPGVGQLYLGNAGFLDINSAQEVDLTGDVMLNIAVDTGGTITGTVSVTGSVPGGNPPGVAVLDPVTLTPLTGFSVRVDQNQNGTYSVSGLTDGCYLVGLDLNQQGESTGQPVIFYENSYSARDGRLVEIVDGQTVSGVDVSIDTASLGTFSVTFSEVIALCITGE